MYKKLRRKFVVVSMSAVFVSLIVIIGAINITNYFSTVNSADSLLDIIEANNGVFPDNLSPDDNSIPDIPEDNIAPDNNIDMEIRDKKDDKDKMLDGISSEAPYNTRYFTVTLTKDSDGVTVSETNTSNIAAITEDTAITYATSLYENGEDRGFLSPYRYRLVEISDTEVMYIFLDCEHELDTFFDFLQSSAIIVVGGLLLIFILLLIFSRSAVRPISESHEKQKRFITDASHEIKTPLAIIDANTEVMEMETGPTQWTTSTRNQIARLNSLTEKMILLSKMDEDEPRIDTELFNISELLGEVTDSFEPICISKGKKLDVDITPDIYFNGSVDSMRQVFTLLLDNAVKYSNSEGNIKVACFQKGHTVNIAFENSVDSISPGRHNELFERFYRPDASRNKETGGFGIGLSTVKAVVEAHKGKITAKSKDEHSILFTILL